MCTIRGGISEEDERGWFLTTSVALPRQKAAEERNFSPKARVRAGEQLACHVRVRRRKGEEATGVERIGAKREGGGKVGRPGIDRLKKGWIFLSLGGGPVV